MYDGHNRTFFFADYAGLSEKRGQVFVNTVPTARDPGRRFQQLPGRERQPDLIYDPLTTRPNPAFDPSRAVSADERRSSSAIRSPTT